MIRLIDILKESLLTEYNKSILDYVSSQLGIERNSEFDSLMNALDAQGIKYPELKDKIIKGEIKSFNDLKALKKQSKSDISKEKKSDSRVVYEDDNFFIVAPYTHAASCYYGKGTKWCTTDKDIQYWLGYILTDKDTLYYILDKTLPPSNPLYKISILVNPKGKIIQTFNAKDDSIDYKEYFNNIKKTKNIYLPDVVDFKSLSKEIEPVAKKEITPLVYKKLEDYIKNFNPKSKWAPLDLSNSEISSLPDNLKVNGDLDLRNTSITSLPKDLKVTGDINLKNTPITSLPDNFKHNSHLNLDGTSIKSLPNNLKIKGYLSIANTSIDSLPDDIFVNGILFIKNTPLAKKYTEKQLKQMYPGLKGWVNYKN